ncbi:MAG: hypothetical protein AAFQ07_10335, partial [Chloroflexota bacterium]
PPVTVKSIALVKAPLQSAGVVVEHAEAYLGTTIEVIPRETRVSPADGHPNELGHQAIANVIAPYVATLPTNNCLFTTAN